MLAAVIQIAVNHKINMPPTTSPEGAAGESQNQTPRVEVPRDASAANQNALIVVIDNKRYDRPEALALAVSRINSGLTVPAPLRKFVRATEQGRKDLADAANKRKQFLQKNGRTMISKLIDEGFALGKLGAVRTLASGKKQVALTMVKEAASKLDKSELAQMLGAMDPADRQNAIKALGEFLAEQAAAPEQHSEPIEVEAAPAPAGT